MTEAVEVLGNLRTARGILGRRKWHKLTRQEQVKIKLATGWEQDAEGHWVMESPDLNQVFPEPNLKFMAAAEEAYKEHCEAADEAHEIWVRGQKEKLTNAEHTWRGELVAKSEAAWREYKRQRDLYRKSGLPKGALKMEAFIKGTPYEEAYPELKGIKVECRVLRGRSGYFSPLTKTICIDKDCVDPQKKLEIVLHEIQHVIQDIEGWGKGGDSRTLGEDNYHRLTGEVAARNASRRKYMPVEERRLLGELGEYQALLEDTEDVARENQLVRDSHNTLKRGLRAVSAMRMSFSTAEGPRNLAAVHTLDAGKLKEAAALGGMPMPSIAVTRLDRPYDWGRGEVALVGAPGMVDPQAGTDVYGGDAWTVMFPYLKRIVTGEASRRASAEMIREMASQYQDPKRTSELGVFARVVDPDRAEAAGADPYMLHRHLTSVEGKALYAYEHGKRVKVRTRHKNYEYTWITEEMLNELAPLVEKHGGMPRGEDARKFADIVERTIRKHEMERIEQLDVEEGKRAHYLEGFMKPYANMLEAWREGHDFRMNGERIAGNVLERNATEIDEPGTLAALGKYADRHKRDYAKWVADKEAAWYSREQYIKRTGKLATLDNLTEEMLRDIGANGSTDWLG